MTSSWPEEPGYHWVTHNDSTTNHLAKANNALSEGVPDIATAQVHALLAQAEATMVVVHTLRDMMARMYEQTIAVNNLRQTIAGFEPPADDDPMLYTRGADVSSEA
jgi:hypothetical protein